MSSLDGYDDINTTYITKRFNNLKSLSSLFSFLKIRNIKDAKTYLKILLYHRRTIKIDQNVPKILFSCPWFSNMYHFIFEGYARLFETIKILKSRGINDFYVILPSNLLGYEKYHNYYITEVLDALSIPQNRRLYLTAGIYELQNIYLPTPVRGNAKIVMEAVSYLKNKLYEKDFVLNLKSASGTRKINLDKDYKGKAYISRHKSAYRRLSNEEEIDKILTEEYSFLTIYMEDLNLKEKINLMMRTRELIAIDGTSHMNCLFMEEGGLTIALRAYEMTDAGLILTCMAKLSFYPIICDVVNKLGDNIWTLSDLYLAPEKLRSKMKLYEMGS